MPKQNLQALAEDSHKSILAPVIPQNVQAAISLMILSGALFGFRFVIFPLSSAESAAKWMTSGSAFLLSVAIVLYGINRRRFWISVLDAAALLLAGLWELRTPGTGPAWAGAVIGGSVGVGCLPGSCLFCWVGAAFGPPKHARRLDESSDRRRSGAATTQFLIEGRPVRGWAAVSASAGVRRSAVPESSFLRRSGRAPGCSRG